MSSIAFAKLFVSVVAMSDTGSISTSAFATELPMEVCQVLAHEFNSKQELQLQGHNATLAVKSFCEPIGDPLVGGRVLPPPIQGMLNGFLNNFPRD